MAYHTNLRRVFDRWDRAVEIANAYGTQTGRKHRVRRVGAAWRVEATDRPIGYGRPPEYTPRAWPRDRRTGRLPGAT